MSIKWNAIAQRSQWAVLSIQIPHYYTFVWYDWEKVSSSHRIVMYQIYCDRRNNNTWNCNVRTRAHTNKNISRCWISGIGRWIKISQLLICDTFLARNMYFEESDDVDVSAPDLKQQHLLRRLAHSSLPSLCHFTHTLKLSSFLVVACWWCCCC